MERFAKDWDVLILVETFLKPEQNAFHINGFETVRFDRLEKNGGGIAFLVKKDLVFVIQIDSIPKSLETGAISIYTSRGNISLITCYRTPTGNNNISSNEWQLFLESIKKTSDKFLIGGDFNSHHTFWGSSRNCPNGNTIYNFTDPDYYNILNNGNHTHISGPNLSKSCIDLSMASSTIALDCEWKVEPDNWRSDHFPISINMDVLPDFVPKAGYRHNTRKSNWNKFFKFWTDNFNIFNSINFLNSSTCDRYSFLINQINVAIELSTSKIKKVTDQNNKIKKARSTSTVWWNDKCEKPVRIRKAKWLSLQHKFTSKEIFDYKKFEAQTKVTLKNEKKNAFQKFCESLNRNSNFNYIFKKIKCFNNKFLKPNSCEGNKTLIDPMHNCIDELCAPGKKYNLPNLQNLQQDNHFLDFFSLLAFLNFLLP